MSEKKKDSLIVPNVIAFADTHVGCKVGLMAAAADTDMGGQYCPSSFQTKLYSWWQEFWREWVPMVCRGDPWVAVHMGDIIDYRHHGATTHWSENLADMRKAAIDLLSPIRELPGCRALYVIRGTEAHSGPAGEEEESIAQALGAVPDRNGLYARYDLRKLVGRGTRKGAAMVHFMHHIGTTGRQHYETSAPHGELIEAFVESARWHHRAPDAVVRAHRHRFVKTEIETATGRALAIVVPGWQGKTPFAYRIAGARQAQPQFGGVLLRHGDEPGEMVYERHFVKSIESDPPE